MPAQESSTPYLLTAGTVVGLAVLLLGVEAGTYAVQGIGGAILVLAVFGLAYYLDRLPGEAH